MLNIHNSNKIIVAFHKGRNDDLKDVLVSAMIKVTTLKDYREGKKIGINPCGFAHTEVIFPKSIAGDKNSFSSRGSSDPSGVHFKNIKYSNPDRWVFVEVDWITNYEDIVACYELAKEYEGCKYAYNNVFNTFGFIRTRKDRKGEEDWWCSEVDAKVLLFKKFKVSPNKFYTMVVLENRKVRGGVYYDS